MADAGGGGGGVADAGGGGGGCLVNVQVNRYVPLPYAHTVFLLLLLALRRIRSRHRCSP